MSPDGHAYSPNWLSPTSFGIWGGTGADRARLARAIAMRIDPNWLWLQVELPDRPKDLAEYAIVDQIPSGQLFLVNPAELAPPAELGNAATWFLRDGVKSGDRLSHLADVVRLPLLAQRLLEGRSVYSATKALVIANSDGLQAMYPTQEGGIRPFIEAFHEYATSVIFTITTPPQPNARDVDYLFRLEAPATDRPGPARAVTQYGAPPDVPALFRAGSSRPLPELIDQIQRR